MEIKVYINGLQRVISGVTPETTCKDVVACLAKATQQFGEFILIEKWRNNERLLHPNDYPVKILNKWGECSREVMFIMKKCEVQSSSSKTHLTQTNHHSGSGGSSGEMNSSSEKFYSTLNEQRRPFNNYYEQCHPLNQDLSGHNRFQPESDEMMPPSSQHSDHNIYNNNSSNNAVYNTNNNNSNTVNGKLLRRPKHPPPYNEALAKSSLMSTSSPSGPKNTSQESSSTAAGSSMRRATASYQPISGDEMKHQPVTRSPTSSLSPKMQFNNDDSQQNLFHNHQQSAQFHSQQGDEKMRDLMKLIALQEKTMNSQDQQLQQLDDEINYYESKFKSDEERVRHLDYEIVRLEKKRLETDHELKELEKLNLHNEIKTVESEGDKLDTDRGKMKIRLIDLESTIGNCEKKIYILQQQIEEALKEKEGADVNDDELNEQLHNLRIQKNEKCKENDKKTEELRQINDEIKTLDELIQERIKNIEQVFAELKEANVQGLNLVPNNDQPKHQLTLPITNMQPDSSNLDHINSRSSFQIKVNRFGAARRIHGSPRELKNAVATSKNPHGVWV